MKVAVFGASGKAGKVFLKQALPEFQIKALIRASSILNLKSSNLELIRGDIFNIEDTLKTVDGCEAVVSFLGHSKKSPPDLQTQFFSKLLPILKEKGIRRVISLTGSGVPDLKNDKRTGFWHLMNEASTKMIGLIDPSRIKDGLDHAKLIMDSDLDWTIVRTPLQLGAAGTAIYWAGQVGITRGWYVKREDIAHFIIKILKEKSYIRELPYLVS